MNYDSLIMHVADVNEDLAWKLDCVLREQERVEKEEDENSLTLNSYVTEFDTQAVSILEILCSQNEMLDNSVEGKMVSQKEALEYVHRKEVVARSVDSVVRAIRLVCDKLGREINPAVLEIEDQMTSNKIKPQIAFPGAEPEEE